jgi:hypothetical protein
LPEGLPVGLLLPSEWPCFHTIESIRVNVLIANAICPSILCENPVVHIFLFVVILRNRSIAFATGRTKLVFVLVLKEDILLARIY